MCLPAVPVSLKTGPLLALERTQDSFHKTSLSRAHKGLNGL